LVEDISSVLRFSTNPPHYAKWCPPLLSYKKFTTKTRKNKYLIFVSFLAYPREGIDWPIQKLIEGEANSGVFTHFSLPELVNYLNPPPTNREILALFVGKVSDILAFFLGKFVNYLNLLGNLSERGMKSRGRFSPDFLAETINGILS